MNQPHHAPHRRQRRPVHRLLTVTAAACVAAGGICFVLSRSTALNPESMAFSRIAAPEPESAALSAPADSAALAEKNSLLSAQQAAAILSDPRMVLVNRQNRMPEDYTFTTRECGSATAINKTLQTEAADAFLAMQAAAAGEHSGRHSGGRHDYGQILAVYHKKFLLLFKTFATLPKAFLRQGRLLLSYHNCAQNATRSPFFSRF